MDGKVVAPEKPVGEFVVVARIKFVVTPLLFLSFHRGKRYWPSPCLIIVVSLICLLSYSVRLYVSFPTEILRRF